MKRYGLLLAVLAGLFGWRGCAWAEGAGEVGLGSKAPLVTLPAGKQPLSKALASFTRQTGVTVTDRRDEGDTEVEVAVKDAPFWSALEALAAAAGAEVYVHGGDRLALVRKPAGARKLPVCEDGLFRLAARRVSSSLALDSGAGGTKVQLEVAWVPGLPLLYLESQPQQVELVAGGKPIPVPAEGSNLTAASGQSSLTLDLSLPKLPRSVAKIDRLEGHLSAVGASKMLTFSFGGLDGLEKAPAKEKEKEQEGVTCRIGRVVLARDRWTVPVTLEYPEGNRPLDSYQPWVVNNELTLVSADGKRQMRSSSYVLEGSSARKAVLSYHFTDRKGAGRGKAGDWKVTYRTPARVIEVPIKFVFKDIELP